MSSTCDSAIERFTNDWCIRFVRLVPSEKEQSKLSNVSPYFTRLVNKYGYKWYEQMTIDHKTDIGNEFPRNKEIVVTGTLIFHITLPRCISTVNPFMVRSRKKFQKLSQKRWEASKENQNPSNEPVLPPESNVRPDTPFQHDVSIEWTNSPPETPATLPVNNEAVTVSEEMRRRRAIGVMKQETEKRRRVDKVNAMNEHLKRKKEDLQRPSSAPPPSTTLNSSAEDHSHPKVHPRIEDPSNMSQRTLERRQAEIREAVKEFFPPGTRITSSPKKKSALSTEECVDLLVNTPVTVSFLRILRSYGITPSIKRIYEKKHELLNRLPSIEMFLIGPDGSKIMATCTSLVETLTYALKKNDTLRLLPPGRIKVTLTADAGGTGPKLSTKIAIYFNDLPNAISVKKLMIIACFPATDSRTYLEAVLSTYFDEFAALKDGIQTSMGVRTFQFFMVVDLKTLSSSMGHQGASALFYCQFCEASDGDCQAGRCGRLRSLEEIRISGNNIQSQGLQDNPRAKQANHSIFGPPLVPSDVVFVAPIMHVYGGVLNLLLEHVQQEVRLDDSLNEMWTQLMAACKVTLHYPAQEYLYKDSSKVVKVIVQDEHEWVPYFPLLKKAVALLPYLYARYYSDAEVDMFELAVRDFFSSFRAEAAFRLTPKCHILECHVVPFFRQYHSWSKFSEQSIECLHKVYNIVASKMMGKTENVKRRVQRSFFERKLLQSR